MFVQSSEQLLASQHRIAPSLFFQPASHVSLMKLAKVTSLYVAVLPPTPTEEEPNPWELVLEIDDSSTIVVRLRQIDPLGHTIVVCSQGRELDRYPKCWRLETSEGTIVSEWLETLIKCGATKYRLVNGFGSRWWIYCALHALKGFLPRGYQDSITKVDVTIWLRIGWSENGTPLPPGEQENLRRGAWLEVA